jgi:hypothetical protein
MNPKTKDIVNYLKAKYPMVTVSYIRQELKVVSPRQLENRLYLMSLIK